MEFQKVRDLRQLNDSRELCSASQILPVLVTLFVGDEELSCVFSSAHFNCLVLGVCLGLHESWSELIDAITITMALIGLVEAWAHHELLRQVLSMINELKAAGHLITLKILYHSLFINDTILSKLLLLQQSLENELLAAVGQRVTWDDLSVVTRLGLRLVDVNVILTELLV